MQQLTYTGPRELHWQDAPEPRLTGDGAALVRPLAVATCDLDAIIIAGERRFRRRLRSATSASPRCSTPATT